MKLIKLRPWYVTGLIDADGCFSVALRLRKVGWRVGLSFSILQEFNTPNMLLIKSQQLFFGGGGSIYTRDQNGSKYVELVITGLKDQVLVRDHFMAYPLQSIKGSYFILWCRVLDYMLADQHLNAGVLSIIAGIKALFPRGLSAKLKNAFPNFVLSKFPERSNEQIPLDPDWIAGFVNGDGSFTLGYQVNDRAKLGSTALPSFRLSQHTRDEFLLRRIMLSFPTSYFVPAQSTQRQNWLSYLLLRSLQSINTRIIPFFTKHTYLWQ